MSEGDAFTKESEPTDDPKTFDLNRWLKRGAVRPVKMVEVYLAAGLEAEIRELDAQIARAKGNALDDRLGTVSPLLDLAQKREALAAEMEESRVVFKFRGLGVGDVEKIQDELGGDKADPTEVTYAIMASQCIAPSGLGAEDFKALSAEMGEQWFTETLLRAAMASSKGSDITVPFSFSASEILRTNASSES